MGFDTANAADQTSVSEGVTVAVDPQSVSLAELTVTSNHDDAEVFVDGVRAGKLLARIAGPDQTNFEFGRIDAATPGINRKGLIMLGIETGVGRGRHGQSH